MKEANELFASPEWAQTIEATYGFDLRWDDDIPYCVLDDAAGHRISALPFSDYLPIDSPTRCHDLLERLKSEGCPLILKTRLAGDIPVANFTVSKRAVYHRYSPAAKASSSFRRSTRKAEGAGTQVHRTNDKQGLRRFQKLYHYQRLRKFGGIPQPASFFAELHDRFVRPGRGFYLEAITANGAHAASLVILRRGDGWFYKFGASDPAYLDERPNNLLFAHLTAAVDEGQADFLDLGLSGGGDSYAGLRRFKRSIGATELPLTYLRHTPEGFDDSAAHMFKSALSGMTDALVAIDADPTTVNPFSETIYRYFA